VVVSASQKTFYIETFGCQMNFHDSEKVVGTLISEGYQQVEHEVDADLIVYNTCSIRDKAEQKVFHRLDEFKRMQKQGKRFAVIADEAHSSQTGEAASKLKAVLTAEELKEVADGGEVSTEDVLAAQMAARTNHAGITYVAFTATPKAKTLEIFGNRPNPDLPAGPGNFPEAFHVYSMRQAIE